MFQFPTSATYRKTGGAQLPILNYAKSLIVLSRRRPDRHGRAQGFGRRRGVGAQQIGDPLEGGEHALVLVSRRRLLRRANLSRWVGSRRPRVDGGHWPRLDVDRGHPI